MADSDFVSVPVAGLLDPEYLARRGQLISATESLGTAAAGLPSLDAMTCLGRLELAGRATVRLGGTWAVCE